LEKLNVWSRSRLQPQWDGHPHMVSHQSNQERGCQCCKSADPNWLKIGSW
jgi:hypothetical protein